MTETHKCLCAAALGTSSMIALLGDTGQASETGAGPKYPTGSLQNLIFGILCQQLEATPHQLEELSTLLAAWQITQAWLTPKIGHSQRLPAAQVWLTFSLCAQMELLSASVWKMHVHAAGCLVTTDKVLRAHHAQLSHNLHTCHFHGIACV